MKVVTSGGEIDIGTAEATPTISLIDFSRRVTDDFGVTTIVPRGFSRRMSARLAIPSSDVDRVRKVFEDLRATSAQWVLDESCAWLNFEGFYKDFELDLAVPPLSYCTLTVEGLAETEALANPIGDPAADASSTLRLISPVEITPDNLTGANVPENDYPAWSAGATYDLGERVISLDQHRVYESAIADNVGHDPALATGQWIDFAPTNRCAMLDQALGTATTRASNIVVTMDVFGVNSIALLDVTAATVRVQTLGYNRLVNVDGGPLVFLDMPLSNAPITVTIAGPGTVSVGTLVAGRLMTLGKTGASPTAGITDFTRKEVDDFGEVTIVERAFAKRMSARALIRTDAIDLVANRLISVRARACLWIGDTEFDSLTIYGFAKDWSIERGVNVSTLSLSVEGLAKAAPPPTPSPVEWEDIVGPGKPEDNATVGAPAGTPVAGRPAEDIVDQIDEAQAGVDAAELLIADHVARLSDIDEWIAEAGANSNAVLAQRASTLEAQMAGSQDSNLRGRIVSVETAVTDGRFAAAGRATTLEAQMAGTQDSILRGRIVSVETAVTDGRFASASRASTLEAQMAGTANSNLRSRIESTETAVTDGRFAAASRATTLEAQMAGTSGSNLRSRIEATETAVTDGRFSTSQRSTNLEARATTLEQQIAGSADSGLRARITTVETATTDGRFAAASRASTLEAQMAGTASSGLRSRIETTETATTDGRFASAQSVTNLTASYNGTAATVTQHVSAISGLNTRTAAYVKTVAVAGNNRAQLTLYADANAGAGVDIIGDVAITGSLTVDGTLTINKLDRTTMTAYTQGQLSGNYTGGFSSGTVYVPNLGAAMAVRDGGTLFFNFSGSSTTTNSGIAGVYNSLELLDDQGAVLASIKLPFNVGSQALSNYLVQVPNAWGQRTVQWRVATRGDANAASTIGNPNVSLKWMML